MSATLSCAPGLTSRVLALLDRADCRQARTPEEREEIFRLRYAAYLREGALPEDPSERFTDEFDETGNAQLFGIWLDGRLASSLRIHVTSREWPETPSTGTFRNILGPYCDAGQPVLDMTRFVADQEASRAYPELAYMTVRIGYMASKHFNPVLGIATVRAEHAPFYRKMFGFRELCPPRPYPHLTKPLGLMCIDEPETRDAAVARYPFFWSSFAERRLLFARPDA